jgi:chaperonin cofactor prefoldin
MASSNNSSPGMSSHTQLQTLSAEYQKVQADLSEAVEARQRLDAQLSENELVKKVIRESMSIKPLMLWDGRNSPN